MTFSIPKHGEICWRELTARNIATAKSFYVELLGWNIEPSATSTVPYDEIHCGERAVGGMIEINENWGETWDQIPAHWMTYIAVDDCDRTIEKIKENGGSICVPAFDAPNVGRIAVANDPSGATFSIIELAAKEA